MKFLYAIGALMMVGLVAAQTQAPNTHPNAELIHSLIKRAKDLSSHTREIMHALVEQHKAHLIGAIEHELIMVEALALDLEVQLKHTTAQNIHHIHVLEESLLWSENRISEELHHILTPEHQANHTVAELIARGDKLVKSANAELAVLGTSSREAKAIERELAAVQHLLREVQIDPAHPVEKAVEQLAKHERTLDTLIKRAKAGGH